MKQTERYVQQATRGVWGRQKRELRTELEGHISERVQEFRLGGMGVEEAERWALRELGEPGRVSSGMLGVHTLPALSKAGALSLLLATTLLTAVPQGLAQVQSIYTTNTSSGPASYLDFAQLKAEIQKVGGRISGQDDNVVFTLPTASRSSLPLNSYGFSRPILSQNGKTYIQLAALLYALQNSGLDISVSGWENPSLKIGSSSIRVATEDWQVVNSLYAATVQTFDSRLWSTMHIPFNLIEPDSLNSNVSFRGQFTKDEVYALIMPKLIHWTGADKNGKPMSGDLNLVTSAGQAQAGSVQFHAPDGFKDFRLFSSLDTFKAALEPYRRASEITRWDADHPAPVLILKLSGHFGLDAYTVVSPASVQRR